MNNFAYNWLKPLDKSLSNLENKQLSALFEYTATACLSHTGVLDRLISIYKKTGNLYDFFALFGNVSEEIKTTEIVKNNLYEIRYQKCFCPLFDEKLMKSPKLC